MAKCAGDQIAYRYCFRVHADWNQFSSPAFTTRKPSALSRS
jgi:hypothetical protein